MRLFSVNIGIPFNFKKQSKKGFTLVELVIVIAVLAILSAIAIPSVSGIVKNANQTADDSNCRAIAATFKMIQAEYDGSTMFTPSNPAALDTKATVAQAFAGYGTTFPKVKTNPEKSCFALNKGTGIVEVKLKTEVGKPPLPKNNWIMIVDTQMLIIYMGGSGTIIP